ncbi:hypothetical protein QYF61_027733, partial [Mycteria americana]
MGKPCRLIISHSHSPAKASTLCLQWCKQPPDAWKHILCPMPPPGTLFWALKSKSYGDIEPQKELKPMPAGSKMDLPLAKAEPINDGDTKASEEGGGGGAPGTRAEIPLQPVLKTMVRQAVSLQPMEVNGGADIHLQPVENPTPEQ